MKTIKGGYYIKARQIKNGWVAHAPPVVREVWDYLIREANHQDKKYNGFIVKRGQLFRSYGQIREALGWHVGFRMEYYHESAMKRGMKALMKERMIELTSKPRGNLITILNYDFYQDPKNYEQTSEQTNERTKSEPRANHHRSAINKNVKNVKNDKKIKKRNIKEKKSVTISEVNMSKDKYLDNVNRYEDNVTNSSYHEKILKEYSDKDKGSIDEHIKQAINWLRINHRKRKGRKGKDGWLNYDVFVSNWLNGSMTKLKMRQKTFEQKQKERWEDYRRTYGEE